MQQDMAVSIIVSILHMPWHTAVAPEENCHSMPGYLAMEGKSASLEFNH